MRIAVAGGMKLVLVGAVASCTSSPKPTRPTREVVQFPVTVNRDLDLLFLIDDSPETADHQARLADNFPKFIDALNALPGGFPNVHIGVATSDMGTQGALDMNPGFGPPVGAGVPGGCSGIGKDGVLQTFGEQANVNDKFISDVADATGARVRNYTGDLATVFGFIAIGADSTGCGFEQHLAAVERALTNPANQGFLRPDAYLGVILLADEDDCSLAHYSLLDPSPGATSSLGELQSFRCTRFGVLCDQGGQTPDAMNQAGSKGGCHPNDGSTYLMTAGHYAAFLRGLKTFSGKIFVAGIAGTPEPFGVELRRPQGEKVAIPALAHSCSFTDLNNMTEVADPAVRIKSFLDQFADHGAFASICESDLSGALQQIGDLVKTVMGPPCFAGPLADEDPRAAGAQYDCMVSVVDSQDPAPERSLPACDREDASATNKPCWHITADPASCPNGSHLTPVVEGLETLATDAYVSASCALAPAG
jgi:hypothetical protein